jgi:hypothetical protein
MGKILYSFKDDDFFSGRLVIFCSDERFVTANLEFLKNHLKIERINLMVLPGGLNLLSILDLIYWSG